MPKSRPHAPGGGDGGDPPPRRRPGSGGPDGSHSISAAQAQTEGKAQQGRAGTGAGPGGGTQGAGPVSGPAANIPLRPPNAGRHNLNSVRLKSRSNDDNTIVLPGTDVAGDLDGIAAGQGKWVPETNRYEINGRTYGVEPTGTVFPVSGPGFVNLTRPEYKVLKQLIGSEGDIGAAREALRRDPNVSDAHWTMALEVFRHHKSYRGEA